MFVILVGQLMKIQPEIGRIRSRKARFDYLRFEVLEDLVDDRFTKIYVNQMIWQVQWDVPPDRGEHFRSLIQVGDMLCINGIARRNKGSVVISTSQYRSPSVEILGAGRGHTLWAERAINKLASGATLIRQSISSPGDGASAGSQREFNRGVPITTVSAWELWSPEVPEDPKDQTHQNQHQRGLRA